MIFVTLRLHIPGDVNASYAFRSIANVKPKAFSSWHDASFDHLKYPAPLSKAIGEHGRMLRFSLHFTNS